MDLFSRMDIPVGFAVAMALAVRCSRGRHGGHEICSHGYWIDYRDIPEGLEREHLSKAIEIITRLTGELPLNGPQVVQA